MSRQGGESRGNVLPFSPVSLFVTLFVCPGARWEKYMHTLRQSEKEIYRVRSTYLPGYNSPMEVSMDKIIIIQKN